MLDDSIYGGGIPVGANHPDTSHAMQEKSRKGSITFQKMIHNHIIECGGCTDDEIEIDLGRSHQSVPASRNMLVRKGLVESSDKVRPTRYGNDAIVWVATK